MRASAAQMTDPTQRAALVEQANRIAEMREGLMACYMAERVDVGKERTDLSTDLGVQALCAHSRADVEHMVSQPVRVDEQAHAAVSEPASKQVSQCSVCLMHTLHCVCRPTSAEAATETDVFVDAAESVAYAAAEVPMARRRGRWLGW